MENNVHSKKISDSTVYRKILEFIQKEGIESFEKLIYEVDDINPHTLINYAIYYNKQPIMELVQRNKVVVEFLQQFENSLLAARNGIKDNDFRKFIITTSRNMDNLDNYIENAKRLEELNVSLIMFKDLTDAFSLRNSGLDLTQIWRDNQGEIATIRKNYTDGIMICKPVVDSAEFQEFKFRISPNEDIDNSPTWLIQSENHENGQQYRYAAIKDFDFNWQHLPTEEELSNYEVPKTLKLVRK